MISGAGMLDFLAYFSTEKLVVDAEAIAMAQRLLQGLRPRTATLATGSFAQASPQGDFLTLPETRQWFRLEQLLPSAVIDRGTLRAWQEAGSADAFARARARVRELLGRYRRPELAADVERELFAIVEREAGRAGLIHLPGVNT
jgi:trimethylamine--corrinoid protein Co-methyltransferase